MASTLAQDLRLLLSTARMLREFVRQPGNEPNRHLFETAAAALEMRAQHLSNYTVVEFNPHAHRPVNTLV
jgi:hypothetical protein